MLLLSAQSGVADCVSFFLLVSGRLCAAVVGVKGAVLQVPECAVELFILYVNGYLHLENRFEPPSLNRNLSIR